MGSTDYWLLIAEPGWVLTARLGPGGRGRAPARLGREVLFVPAFCSCIRPGSLRAAPGSASRTPDVLPASAAPFGRCSRRRNSSGLECERSLVHAHVRGISPEDPPAYRCWGAVFLREGPGPRSLSSRGDKWTDVSRPPTGQRSEWLRSRNAAAEREGNAERSLSNPMSRLAPVCERRCERGHGRQRARASTACT